MTVPHSTINAIDAYTKRLFAVMQPWILNLLSQLGITQVVSGGSVQAPSLTGQVPPATLAQTPPAPGQALTGTPNPPTVANPTVAPTLSAGGTGGTLTPGVYTVGYTWTTTLGQTALSPTATVTVASGEIITYTLPAFPTGTIGAGIYASQAGGTTLTYVLTAKQATGTFGAATSASAASPPPVNASGGVTTSWAYAQLAQLTDVLLTALADGNLLTYDATAGVWVNKPPAFPNPMAHVGDVIYGGAGGAGLALVIDALNKVLTVGIGAPYLTPPAAPAPTTTTSGGTVAAGTYGSILTYVNAQGETTGSVAGSVTTVGSTSTVTVPSPPAQGTDSLAATGYHVYMTQPGGSAYTRQTGSPVAIGTAFTLTTPPTSSGPNPPVSNTAASIVPVWGAVPNPVIYSPLTDTSGNLIVGPEGGCIMVPIS